MAGLFVSRRFHDGNSALGEHVVGLREVAAHELLEQCDGMVGVVDVLLVDVRGGAGVLVAHELTSPARMHLAQREDRRERAPQRARREMGDRFLLAFEQFGWPRRGPARRSV
jgi:hypothetical protein